MTVLAALLPWGPEEGGQCCCYHPFEKWLQIWGEELKDSVCHSQSPHLPMLSWCLSMRWHNGQGWKLGLQPHQCREMGQDRPWA